MTKVKETVGYIQIQANSEHALWGDGQPSAQRANGALVLAAIKSTRLVANANRPEGNYAFPVSPYHTTETTETRCHKV